MSRLSPQSLANPSKIISFRRIWNFILLYFCAIDILTIDASNILRYTDYNQATFILKETGKKHATAPFSTTTVQEAYECLDTCTDHSSCKSVNINENTSPLGCELVNNDRNSLDSYVDAPGYKHYDTGKTTLSRWVNEEYGTGKCFVPQSLSCEPVTSQIVLATDVSHCSKPYAIFSYDFEKGSLAHHCSGLSVCVNNGLNEKVHTTTSCAVQSKSNQDGSFISFRRFFGESLFFLF